MTPGVGSVPTAQFAEIEVVDDWYRMSTPTVGPSRSGVGAFGALVSTLAPFEQA